MLAFIHIPKTAGTTLHKILSHQYARTFIHHDHQGPVTEALVEAITRAKTQVVMGHLSVGLHHWLPDIRYITCLRDPVARIISHYHHALNDPQHYLHHQVVDQQMDLAAYASSGISGELDNGMTRMLAGVADFHHAPVDASTLATAKHHLESLFDGIILSETFDAGVLSLAEKLRWSTPYYLRRKVGRYPSSDKKTVARTRALIEEHNRFDCELYAWARDRNHAQLQATPGIDPQVARFRRRNRSIGKVVFCVRECRRRLLHPAATLG